MDLLAFLMTGNAVWYPALDESWFRALNLVGTNAVLDVLMVALTDLALPYVLALLAIPLWWKGRKEEAFDLLVVLLVVIVVTEVLKYAFDRARPCDVLPNPRLLFAGACQAEGDPAFPSGHTSRIFAVAAFLSVYHKRGVRLSSALLAIGAGISRVYLGVHWPTDVIAGAAVGIAMALAFVLLARRSAGYQRLRGRIVRTVSRALPRRAQAT